MLESMGRLFIGHPLRIAAIAAVILLAYTAKRRFAPARTASRALMIAGVLWGLYALWEGLLPMLSPDGDIRVDLLLIYPVLALATLWALSRGWR